jgi:hypothetical protein
MQAVDQVTLNLRALVVWGAMPTREDVAASVPVDQVSDAGLRARIERMAQVYSLPSHVAAYIAGRALAGDVEGLRCWNVEALQAIGLQIAERRLSDQVDRALYARWYAEDLRRDLSALAEYAARFREEEEEEVR